MEEVILDVLMRAHKAGEGYLINSEINRRAVLNYPVPAIRWASEEDFTGMTHYPATETEQRVVTMVPADGFTRITSHDRRILCEPGRSSPASCLQHAGTSFANGALS